MKPSPQCIWKRLSLLFPADQNYSQQGKELFREYESHAFLGRPIADLLNLDLAVVVDFFHRIALMHTSESPILRRRDTRWMCEFDYTLVNIRAAGAGGQLGNFLTSTMLLTTLRTRGIIVAPVTRGASEDLGCLESHVELREELVHAGAREAGIDAETQMTVFCEAAHLLGLALGFELDYRVDPLAAVVINRPELFFWTKGGDFDPSDGKQNNWRKEVREGLAGIRRPGTAIKKADAASVLSESGLAALPSSDGSGRTPLAFRSAATEGGGKYRDAAVEYWSRVFDHWRDRYGFDFLLLRGTQGADGDSEAPPPPLIRQAVHAAQKAGVRRNIGIAAEGRALDVELYGLQGSDLVLENNAESKADYRWFRDVFTFDELLHHVNFGRKVRFSSPMETTPGDDDHHSQRSRALIKRFVARFLGTGPSRRPLLESMGSLEGAWGYGQSLKKAMSLGWMPDAKNALMARSIENVAKVHRDMMDGGERLDEHLDPRTAWWVIRSRRGLIVAVVSVENEDLLPPQSMYIDYADYLGNHKAASVVEYDFHGDRGMLNLKADETIAAEAIPYRGFRLYIIA